MSILLDEKETQISKEAEQLIHELTGKFYRKLTGKYWGDANKKVREPFIEFTKTILLIQNKYKSDKMTFNQDNHLLLNLEQLKGIEHEDYVGLPDEAFHLTLSSQVAHAQARKILTWLSENYKRQEFDNKTHSYIDVIHVSLSKLEGKNG